MMQLWRGEAVDIWDARGLRLGHMMSKSQPKDCHRASPWSPTIMDASNRVSDLMLEDWVAWAE